jgi:hypothetical protein
MVILDIGNSSQTSSFNQLSLKEEALQLRRLVCCLHNHQTGNHYDHKVKTAKIRGAFKNKIPGGKTSHPVFVLR